MNRRVITRRFPLRQKPITSVSPPPTDDLLPFHRNFHGPDQVAKAGGFLEMLAPCRLIHPLGETDKEFAVFPLKEECCTFGKFRVVFRGDQPITGGGALPGS